MKNKKLPKYKLAGSYPIVSVKKDFSLPSTPAHINPSNPSVVAQNTSNSYETYDTVGEVSPTFQMLNSLAFGIGSIANTVNEYKNRNQERQKYIQSIQQPFNTRSGVQNDLPIYTKYGGKAKYGIAETSGLPESQRHNATIEAEKGEIFEDNQGNINKISDYANSHEEGGVLLNNVQRVLEDTSTTRNDKNSKLLRLTPSMVQDLFGIKPKTTLSHSEALEFVNEHLQKQEKKAYNKILETAEFLDKNKNDKFANNSLEMNAKYIDSLPKKEDVFNVLFENQENIKQSMNIGAKKAKYGIDIVPDITLKGKDKGSGTTPTGRSNMNYNFTQNELNNYAESLGLDNSTNESFQEDLYRYALRNNPDAVKEMWKLYGDTKKGRNLGISFNVIDENGKPSKARRVGEDFNTDIKAFVDGDPKARTMFLLGRVLDSHKNHTQESIIPTDRNRSFQLPTPPSILSGDVQDYDGNYTTVKSTTSTSNKGISKFDEQLRLSDILPEAIGLLENDRIPTNLNEVSFSKVTPKLLNPLPALQAGQRDFNAAISKLPSGSGAGMANAVNAFSQKYAIDNNIIGQYDNSNNQIENQARYYNAGVDDKQSAADAQSREQFERKQLGSIEAQRQQKMAYLDSIMSKINQNRALNRNGNLIMQTAPNFNSYGQYNGNQRYITMPSASQSSGISVQYVQDPNSGAKYRIMLGPDGKLISSSKVVQDKYAVGSTRKS